MSHFVIPLVLTFSTRRIRGRAGSVRWRITCGSGLIRRINRNRLIAHLFEGQAAAPQQLLERIENGEVATDRQSSMIGDQRRGEHQRDVRLARKLGQGTRRGLGLDVEMPQRGPVGVGRRGHHGQRQATNQQENAWPQTCTTMALRACAERRPYHDGGLLPESDIAHRSPICTRPPL